MGKNPFNKLFKRKNKTAGAEIDAELEGLDKAGDDDNSTIKSKKKKGGAVGFLKKRIHIRIKRKNSKKADGDDSEKDSSDDEADNKNKKGKKKKPKAPKVKKEKKPKAAKKKKKAKSGGGDGSEDGQKKKKPIVLIAIIGGGVLAGVAAFLIISFMNRPTVEQQLLDAQLLLNEQKYDEAGAIYEKLIKKDDALVEAYIGTADVKVGKEDTEGALQGLTDALAKTSDDPRIQAKIDELTPKPDPEDSQPAAPSSEPLVFKDEAFAKLLRQAMGKSPADPISEIDLAEITQLKILGETHAAVDENIAAIIKSDGYIIDNVMYSEHGTIKSLADLAHFKKLRKLTVAYNSIEDISGIEGLADLHTVALYFNNVRNVAPLSNLINLKYLYMYNNNISDISPLSPLVNLEQLWLNNNQITDISVVKNFPNLEELVLNNNQVTDISAVSNLSQLCFLYIDKNNVSDISAIKDMASLTDVSFIDNPVTDLSPASHVNNVNRSYSS